jgi:dihydrofolate reductase
MRSLVEVDISMSLDGFITGPDEQAAGLGRGGEPLHYWFTKDPAGPDLLDDALFATAGAVVTSRKVYDGTDGWGESGFYRMPVFVLTHRPHEVVVKGETTFTFVTDGIESAIAQARAAADEKKVHIMGGATSSNRPCGPASSTASTSTSRRSSSAREQDSSTTSRIRSSSSEPRSWNPTAPRT